MEQRKQEILKLARCNIIFGFFLFLGIAWLPKIHAQQQKNELANNKLVQALSKRNLNFAFKIYKLMADKEDFMLSPLSISVALTMTSFGARNNTLKQMLDVLDLNGFKSPMDIAKGYSDILRSLDLKGADITLAISNRIFIDKNFSLKKPFKDILVNEFRSEPESVNFLDNGQVLNNEINKYVEQTTKNKIENLASFGNDEKIMGAVLVSAIYFKGNWAQQFRKESTYLQNFHLKSRKDHMENMMHTRAEFYYGEDKILNSKILKVDYSGFRFVMYIILPNNSKDFKTLKKSLTCQRFESIKKNMKLREVLVALPKFNSKCMKDLLPDLKDLDISDLEVETSVDQPSGKSLYVQKVLYAAYMEMGEEGTSAVARPNEPAYTNSSSINGVSSRSGGSTNSTDSDADNDTYENNDMDDDMDGDSDENHGGHTNDYTANDAVNDIGHRKVNNNDSGQANTQKEKLKEFKADHPFVFIIYDTFTNFILFIGSVDNPLQ